MNRAVNHNRLPGETIREYNERIERETLAYKTTVQYKLFQMRMDLRSFKDWARSVTVKKEIEGIMDILNTLSCYDFGENENGEIIPRNNLFSFVTTNEKEN